VSARLLLLTVLTLLLLCAPARAEVACDRYAGPFGTDTAPGSLAQPYRTAQKLTMSLSPGETGCLLAGTYSDEVSGHYVLNVKRSGAPGAPITIRSAPGQRAQLRGIVQVPAGYHHIVVSNLDIDARRVPPGEASGMSLHGADVTFEDNTITNDGQAICMILGSNSWGRAVRTVVQRNTFHDCGAPQNKLEHSVYVAAADGTLITDNVFLRSGGYAVHLYPDAQDTTVTHNVMVGGGGGVIFAGEGDAASSRTVVARNVITDSATYSGIRSFWGGTAVGRDNLARENCLIRNRRAQIDLAGGGFSATDNLIADPGFRDPAAGDYRLAPAGPCLELVGYDTAAKLRGETVTAPEPEAAPEPSATPEPTPTPRPTATPAPTTTPRPTATPRPTTTPTPPPPPPSPPVAPQATPPPVDKGTQPGDPVDPPVEGAELVLDDAAFSASGGSTRPPSRCRRRPRRCA
jgi:hypothetical protein